MAAPVLNPDPSSHLPAMVNCTNSSNSPSSLNSFLFIVQFLLLKRQRTSLCPPSHCSQLGFYHVTCFAKVNVSGHEWTNVWKEFFLVLAKRIFCVSVSYLPPPPQEYKKIQVLSHTSWRNRNSVELSKALSAPGIHILFSCSRTMAAWKSPKSCHCLGFHWLSDPPYFLEVPAPSKSIWS